MPSCLMKTPGGTRSPGWPPALRCVVIQCAGSSDAQSSSSVIAARSLRRRSLASSRHEGHTGGPSSTRFQRPHRALTSGGQEGACTVSEQVRQPLYTGSLGKWRRYEAELGFWLEELAPVLETLPPQVRDAGARL